MHIQSDTVIRSFLLRPLWALLACVLLFPGQASAQSEETTRTLEYLTDERMMLTTELEQYRKTLEILHTDAAPPEESANPAVRKLAQEVVALKERLIAITEREVTLLQEQIALARVKAEREEKKAAAQDAIARAQPSARETPPADAMESKPLRTNTVDYTLVAEADNVERLHQLLENHYTELQESSRILPTQEELAKRALARQDAETLSRIPFSVDKVRLSGEEGSIALAHISRRLIDPTIPESRRDIAPICTIKTRLFNTLVGSESRSLRPVGKNHYIARVRLQPGDTTLSVLSMRWELSLPQHVEASDFIITLYQPPGGTTEMHVFAVDDLLAAKNPHIPAWLPDQLKLKTQAG